tara:strand:+ start:83 stop:301 length:219 start_codon:yes stop_codon:yes gene_type:complete
MSKPRIDRATGEINSEYSNIGQNDITEFIMNKDKLLIQLVRFIDHSVEVLGIVKDLKSDIDKLIPLFKNPKK